MRKFFAPAMGLVLLLTVACTGKKSDNTVAAGEAVAVGSVDSSSSLQVDSMASVLHWRGFKPGGEHWGHMAVSSGSLSIEEGRIFGGRVEIAMNGIVVDDLKGEMAAKLKGHLESADFFEVEVYPTASFELTDIPAEGLHVDGLKEIKGNFTLKGVTKNIIIPIASVSVNAEDGAYTVESATFRINRADWGVKYGSKSFFANLGDAFIDDEIELSFLLKALSR